MVEATIIKAVIVQDKTSGISTLFAVAAHDEDRVNVKVHFSMETLDVEGFTKDLREQLAEDFDLPVYRVHIPPGLIKKMAFYDSLYKAQRKGGMN